MIAVNAGIRYRTEEIDGDFRAIIASIVNAEIKENDDSIQYAFKLSLLQRFFNGKDTYVSK